MKKLIQEIQASSYKCQAAGAVYAKISDQIVALEKQLEEGMADLDFKLADVHLDQCDQCLNQAYMLLVDLSGSEIARIEEKLRSDFHEQVDIGEFYEVFDLKGYVADYGEMAGQTFKLPSFVQIMQKMNVKYLQLYQQMKEAALEPKLQITPIGLKIRTLVQKINAKKRQVMTRLDDIQWYKGEFIKDEDLIYGADAIKSVKNGSEIEITGGKSKAEWIKENRGFLVDIVPLKETIEADESIVEDATGEVNCDAVQSEKNLQKLKANGYTPMSYESYLVMQMRALKVGKELDSLNKGGSPFCVLLDSNIKDRKQLAAAYLNGDHIALCAGPVLNDIPNTDLNVRGTIRIK